MSLASTYSRKASQLVVPVNDIPVYVKFVAMAKQFVSHFPNSDLLQDIRLVSFALYNTTGSLPLINSAVLTSCQSYYYAILLAVFCPKKPKFRLENAKLSSLFRTDVCVLCPQRVLAVAAPDGFLSWLEQHEPTLLADAFPVNKKFRRTKITAFLLDDASQATVEKLIDVSDA